MRLSCSTVTVCVPSTDSLLSFSQLAGPISAHMSVKSCTSNTAHVQNVKLNCGMWLSKNNPMLLLSHMLEFIKVADIKHLIKKTDPCDWFNYQSVSHMSFISKVLVKAVAQQPAHSCTGTTLVRCSTQDL